MSVFRVLLAVACIILISACATARPMPGFELTEELTKNLVASSNVFAQVNVLRHGRGSGLIVSRDGYVLTCEHVVRHVGRTDIVATVSHGLSPMFPATVVAVDPQRDLALLKADTTFAHAADLEEPPTGATDPRVYGLTLPKTGMHKIMIGVVKKYPFSVDMRPAEPADFKDGILADMPAEGGMSGTGVFSAATGKVLGIHKLSFRTADGERSVIISTKEIRQFLRENGIDLK